MLSTTLLCRTYFLDFLFFRKTLSFATFLEHVSQFNALFTFHAMKLKKLNYQHILCKAQKNILSTILIMKLITSISQIPTLDLTYHKFSSSNYYHVLNQHHCKNSSLVQPIDNHQHLHLLECSMDYHPM